MVNDISAWSTTADGATVSWLGQTEAPPDHSTIVGTDAQEDAATQADAAADAVTGQQNSQAGRRGSTPVARSKLS